MRHEKTFAYQRSIELMETTREVIEQLPKGFSFLADQLRRNTTSVANNFAEGYYQRSVAQRRRYFEYAIQSARESSASFDAVLVTCLNDSSHNSRSVFRPAERNGFASDRLRMTRYAHDLFVHQDEKSTRELCKQSLRQVTSFSCRRHSNPSARQRPCTRDR